MATVDELTNAIAALGLPEAHKLRDALRARLGAPAVFATVDDMGSFVGAYGAPPAGLFYAWTVTLDVVGPRRLEVVGVVREAMGPALGEALARLERVPFVLRDGLSHGDAQSLAARLGALGATASVASEGPA